MKKKSHTHKKNSFGQLGRGNRTAEQGITQLRGQQSHNKKRCAAKIGIFPGAARSAAKMGIAKQTMGLEADSRPAITVMVAPCGFG
jgi:hypothetical protein